MLRDIYNKGVAFDEFILSDGSSQKQAMQDFVAGTKLDENISDLIISIDKKIKIIVFGEVWCPDCVINISALEIINKVNSDIEFKVLPREGHEAFIKEQINSEKAYIPTFIIMDEEYNKLGVFIERPEVIKELEDSGDQVKRIVMMKAYRKGDHIIDTIQDVVKIATR